MAIAKNRFEAEKIKKRIQELEEALEEIGTLAANPLTQTMGETREALIQGITKIWQIATEALKERKMEMLNEFEKITMLEKKIVKKEQTLTIAKGRIEQEMNKNKQLRQHIEELNKGLVRIKDYTAPLAGEVAEMVNHIATETIKETRRLIEEYEEKKK